MSVTPKDVTACLVTRGDVDLTPILDTIPYHTVLVWNNAERDDKKTAGRYYAALEATTPFVYFQDDDVIFRHHAELIDAYEPGLLTAVYAHGETPGGYDDMPLVGAGALVDRELPWRALNRYLDFYPADVGFLYEADFIAGVLYPTFRHVRLPFEIRMEVAQHPSRLCNQPWQEALKFEVTERARVIRDMAAVTA